MPEHQNRTDRDESQANDCALYARNADQSSDIRHRSRVNVRQRQTTQTHQKARIFCEAGPSGNASRNQNQNHEDEGKPTEKSFPPERRHQYDQSKNYMELEEPAP